MTNIMWLSDLRAGDAPQVGGKAANLGELMAAGLPTPDGFAVTVEAFKHGMDEALADEIADAYRRLVGDGDQRVAVRSSALSEDSAQASFAGQQDTILQVEGPGLVEAVEACWASLRGERAQAYREQLRLDADPAMGVVVQRMVQAVCAGVLFTANPANGHLDQSVVSAAWGLGDAVVSGRVEPDELVVAAGRVVSRKLGAKGSVIEAGGPTTLTTDVVKTLRNSAVLDDAEALALVGLGEAIQRHFGGPQDIEWAMDADGFHILQARPITALAERVAEAKDVWPSEPGNMYFRASIVEQLPDPLTPLFADMAPDAVVPALRGVVAQVAGDFGNTRRLEGVDVGFPTINGYAYYRFSNKALRKLTAVSLPALRGVFADGGRALVARWRCQTLPAYQAAVAQARTADLAALSLAELLDGVQELLLAGCEYYSATQTVLPVAGMAELAWRTGWRTLVGADPAPPEQFVLGYDSTPVLAEKRLWDLSGWVAQDEALAAAIAGGAGAGEAPPDGVSDAVWQEWRQRFGAYLDEYGHTVYNLDFANPVPADDPSAILQGLRFNLAGKGADPYARQAGLAQRRDRVTEQLFARLDPIRAKGARRTLKWAQEMVPVRETALAAIGLAWPVMRRRLAEVGRRLVEAGTLLDADDVYWLRRDEIAEDADAGLRTLIDDRKAIWRGQARLTPPPYLPRSGAMRAWDSFMPSRQNRDDARRLNGNGSGGVVTGRARVVNGPDEFADFEPGEILVAPITTPAFTPLFAVAAGVVTDVGGVLSHGSIVAREYGIPAVLGAGQATRRIKTGDEITVDGVRGAVWLAPADGIVAAEHPWLRWTVAGAVAAGAVAGVARKAVKGRRPR
ncbi:MAG: phosphoenolpyruvate synthase [Propionibacteriaceae bacterium]|jgi:pyruvate,water dikinase|nr:phosphoenolpyruvate synthase [Propionibacteriaceae bacterium]